MFYSPQHIPEDFEKIKKMKDFFPLNEWEAKGLNISDEETVDAMNQTVREFITFFETKILTNEKKWEKDIALYILQNIRKDKRFDNEEYDFLLIILMYIAKSKAFHIKEIYNQYNKRAFWLGIIDIILLRF